MLKENVADFLSDYLRDLSDYLRDYLSDLSERKALSCYRAYNAVVYKASSAFYVRTVERAETRSTCSSIWTLIFLQRNGLRCRPDTL